ncbi:ABC transporter A family member 7-like isoform X1 [Vigna unguiculata]|uniref:ATP-binding cassette n=2 Tax=Vigna unguiculata TaxID=3917 RepID=A0A4D6KWA9_VIGUN|nr:ABC transporter A family member 7-like isoform X1 [Vigna unguiculata]QCD80883.1 ATP-binding cassette [Vigna unguiculata]
MANSASASFSTQANALLLKNITFQKRNVKTNLRLILVPVVLCLLLFLLQLLFDTQLNKSKFKCGCVCADNRTKISQCPESEKRCGVQYSDFFQAAMCAIPNPVEWPPLLQLPAPPNRAVRTGFLPFFDLPDASCRRTDSCPLSLLFTGENHSFALSVSENMFRSALSISDFGSNFLAGLAVNVLGSESKPGRNNFIEPAFSSKLPIYYLQTNCTGTENSGFSFPSLTGANNEIKCALAKNLWRNSSTEINSELYKGYQRGNSEGQINEIVSAFDFLNSNGNRYNVGIWYNSTYYQEDTGISANALLRIPRSVNLISNSYLQFLLGPGTKIIFEFVKEMPKPETIFRLDISSIVGSLFFTWVILQLFPVILTSLVYEKQQKLRIMMKMHGLGDRPYWMISYGYFLVISVIYMLCFVIFGSLLGLKIFTVNDYSIQFVFYFIYINLQIALAFLVATMFSNVKTATVTAYIGVFGTGLLGGFLFRFFVQNTSFPRGWIILMELYPGFALYRGLYELAQFSIQGNRRGTDGMKWHSLSESTNGMKEVLIIMFAEWIVILFAAFYIDQVLSSGSRKCPLFLLKGFQKKSPFQKLDTQMEVSKEFSQMEKPDVIQEKEKVEELLLEPTINHAILCDDLRKVYPGRDGNPDKFAVRGLFLSVPHGECFGMLGPNGAGKTSFINMMIGLTKPTSGRAFVQGLDIRTQMGGIYTTMGVCPQHDLLWDSLTGREHLLFYGRLKNLRGSVLTQAVEDSLKGLNLFHGGVADKQVGKYSGGMKRRLSVAISLIGDPKVVYMDEPSSGLDPASRKSLWNVVKHAKQNRAIILTTHSMEEAEALCDRLGIFVNGSLQCVGNAKELKARYGGTYVLTVTTSSEHEKDVENMVQKLTPNANKIYHLSGTQKFELPKEDVRISDVFQAVDVAKRKFSVCAWGLVDTTLEDVFIKVAREAQAFDTLS